MIAVIVAGALVGGRSRLPEALGLGVVVMVPKLAAAVVASAVVINLMVRRNTGTELHFHRMVASELRGGASLRHALAAALISTRDPTLARIERRLTAGYEIEEAAASIRPYLPHTGRLAEAAIVFGGRSGGRAAAAFQSMAEIAAGELDLRREVAAAMAPAWLAVGLIGGAPLLGFAVLVTSGRLGETVASGPGRVTVVVGGALVAAGATVVWLLARRALR